VNGPDRLPIRRPEGAEVVPADEGRPGARHRVGVERDPDPERQALAKRAARPVPDGVAVLPVPRREAGVPTVRDPAEVADRDVRRQKAVDALCEPLRREAPAPGECDHLSAGVNPCVGPAGPVDPHARPVAEADERVFEHSLDGPRVSLQLEAREVRPVIFDPCAEADGCALSSSFAVAVRRQC
jgi:hypothetical protein